MAAILDPKNFHMSNEATKLITVKTLSQSLNGLSISSIPSSYNFTANNLMVNAEPIVEDTSVQIPTIDFSLLTSDDPNQRSKVVDHQLRCACENWGFFMVTNHEVPSVLMSKVLEGVREFFNMTEEEKREFKGNDVLDPIRCGTSFNASLEKVLYWRDFLKVFVHPQFHFPNKPFGFSDIALEYCKRTRDVFKVILEGIWNSLGLEAEEIMYKDLNLDSSFQIFIANLYPPCPQPELALGMPPHSDHGLLTILIQNDIDGLQVQHDGKWVNVKAIPNSFLVNTGDHLEIVSNGKYKSNIHRVVVNSSATRVSLAIANGPSLDTVVSPSPELVRKDPPLYTGIRYKEYIRLQQSNNLDGKSILDRIRH